MSAELEALARKEARALVARVPGLALIERADGAVELHRDGALAHTFAPFKFGALEVIRGEVRRATFMPCPCPGCGGRRNGPSVLRASAPAFELATDAAVVALAERQAARDVRAIVTGSHPVPTNPAITPHEERSRRRELRRARRDMLLAKLTFAELARQFRATRSRAVRVDLDHAWWNLDHARRDYHGQRGKLRAVREVRTGAAWSVRGLRNVRAANEARQ